MKKFNFTYLVILLFISTSGFSQSKLNSYKYAIIPHRFDFQTSPNSYQINALLKFLFTKEGFTTVYSDDKLPEELAENPCTGLKVKLVNLSTMFTTKVQIELVDCRNQNIFTTGIGKSREKIIKKGFYFAIKMAFRDIEKLNYVYHKLNTENKNRVTVNAKKTSAILKQHKSIKANNKRAVQPLIKTTVSNRIDKNKGSNYYKFINQELKLEVTTHGFIISKKENNGPYVQLGLMIKSSIKNVYLFQYDDESLKNTIAYFDQEGNLIIDNFKNSNNKSEVQKEKYLILK